MSFGWGDFLEFARKAQPCVELSPINEARDRAIVGRAYYAAFGAALAYFAGTNRYRRAPRPGDNHENLPRFLKAQRDSDEQTIGAILLNMKAARTWADYETGRPPSLFASPGTAITQSQRVLDLVDRVQAKVGR